MDYTKVTMMEYQAKKRKIFESLGILKGDCKGTSLICDDCPFIINTYTVKCGVSSYNEQYYPQEAIKLVMDYEIPTDWTKIDVDTPILVSIDGNKWHKRYFAKYDDDIIYAFNDGRTSWTALPQDYIDWKYVKLAE